MDRPPAHPKKKMVFRRPVFSFHHAYDGADAGDPQIQGQESAKRL